jgi:tetrahedral aminopeptidase
VATTGEETSFLGARALAASLRPGVVVVVDVIWASDHPRVDARLVGGTVRLGAGPVLNRGGGMSERLLELARAAAADAGIPLQMRAVAGATLSDADELLPIPGAETLAVSIPLRYMHSPHEVVSGEDVELTARLVAAVVERLRT